MQNQNGLVAIQLNMNGRFIHPTLIWDGDDVVLVDTGFPGQFDDILGQLYSAGISLGRLTKVILTHQDLDHIGNVAEIVHAVDHKITVFAHQEDTPHIQGEKPLLKNPGTLVPKVVVDQTVSDGEVLPYCGGIIVIHTPGHTPGHICLYHPRTKTLISGDALVVVEGTLQGPKPEFTPDMDEARKSLHKLGRYDIDVVFCYHGGPYRDNVNKRIDMLTHQANN